MGLYVDKLHQVIVNRKWKFPEACHLIADTETELHKFADGIGLKREWFQKGTLPHYDLTKNKRILAVRKGAKEINRLELTVHIENHRNRNRNNLARWIHTTI